MPAGAVIETILVVDDEPQIRRAVGNALGGTGRRIVEAATGREALDLAASGRPDAIILDLGLPDLDGIDVCREIRHWANMPIVVLSARHSDQEKVRLLNAGADDYVTKPFSTTELAARVNAQIRRASAPQSRSEDPIMAGDLASRPPAAHGAAPWRAGPPYSYRVGHSEHPGVGARSDPDSSAHLRRGVGPALWKSSAVSASPHHQHSA